MSSLVYRGAALIIGSLWWDNDKREEWRRNRLQMGKASQVRLPIRYGRESAEDGPRRGTYTMVFSSEYIPSKLGQGYLVPLRNPIKDIHELVAEAENMWFAEGGKEKRLAGSWGCVALFVNPEGTLPNKIITDWKEYFVNTKYRKPIFSPVDGESPIVSEDGMLLMNWKIMSDKKELFSYDFGLATATVPDEKYPSPQEISSSLKVL